LGKGPGALEMAEAALAEQSSEEQDEQAHPRLAGEIAEESDEALIGVLKELIAASEEVSWAKLENREPMLPAYFKTYDKRRETAEKVGSELLRRRGAAVLQNVLRAELGNYASIGNWWRSAGLLD
jgi:hypothetical protein